MTSFRNVRALFALLVFLAALPVAASAQENAAARQRAEAAINEGRYREALSVLQGLIGDDTRDPQLYVLRARAYEGREEFQRAIEDYERALALSPDLAAARQGLQRVQQRSSASARTDLEGLRRLVVANPGNPQYRLRYAEALYEASLFRDAAAQYETYLQGTQGTPDILKRYLISIASYEGDNDKGEQVAERYLQFYPTDDDLHMRLGYFRLWQGKFPQSIQAFEQALRLNPSNVEAQRGLDQARQQQQTAAQRPATPAQQQRAQASQYPIDVLLRDLERNPDQDARRFELVDLLIGAGRFFEARQQLDRLADRHRDETAWQQRYATVERGLASPPARTSGPTDFVVDRLMRELRSQPNDVEKRFQLVRELIRYDRFSEAYDHLLQLADRYDTTERWLDLFRQIDQGLVRTAGSSPIYPVDRYTYLLRLDPAKAETRYALVDALLEAGRLAEAYTVLTDRAHVDPSDERYQVRLRAIADVRERLTAERIATLEAQLARTPGDAAALRELAALYVESRRPAEAVDLYRRLLQADPGNTEARAGYAQVLAQTGDHAEALRQAGQVLDREPGNTAYQRLYVTTAIAGRSVDARAEQLLARLLESTPDDAELLLEASSLRMAQGQVEEADRLIRRAQGVADAALQERLETQSLLIERELIRQQEAEQSEILNDARRLAQARLYREAVARYEEYFQVRGKRTRGELKELAMVYHASGDFVSALSILEALQAQLYEYDVAKDVAKNRFYMQDYAGAIQVLEQLVEQNPRDFEVRMLLSDAYRQLQRYPQARAVYQDVVATSANGELVEERLLVIEASSVTGLTSSRPDEGLDYVGLIVPVAEATVARGSGTAYNRWAQGLMTQVTLPIDAVLYAGLTSHFLSGTRRLIPFSEEVQGRVNQVYGGGYIDLTDPIPLARASYTNRLQFLGGIFDYEGGRTVPFGELRYWRQEPGLYTGSIGVRATEGAIDLWSPAGGEFALRLTQADVRVSTASALPDSLLRLSGVFAYNIVTDNFGSTNTRAGTNQGTNIQIEGSYRIIPATYLGLQYYQLSYRNTVDIYFSPRNFQTYTAFLEYEREYGDKWYLRVRGSVGAVARSNGFIARRLETDLIYRFARRWAINIASSIGQSTRTLGNESLATEDVYNTFIFAGQLYWTL